MTNEQRAIDDTRAEVLRHLLEWEAEYMQQARGGDNSGRSDARADAAREIHDHLRASWETRAALAAVDEGQPGPVATLDRGIPVGSQRLNPAPTRPAEPVLFVHGGNIKADIRNGIAGGHHTLMTRTDYYDTPLYAEPIAQRQPLTIERIMDCVMKSGLDWNKGWVLEDGEPNRFSTLARAIERAHGIGGAA